MIYTLIYQNIRSKIRKKIDFNNKRFGQRLSRILRNKSKHMETSKESITIEDHEIPCEKSG
jgi:hypothetical protein